MRQMRTETNRRKTPQMLEIERSRGATIEAIIRAGHERGWTQEEIARDLGISRSALAFWFKTLGVRYRIEFDSERAGVA
jgi:AraC-like DNA-binding protein